ncbi:MAG: NAD(P)-binding protein [Acidimicrobiaceae bacterium]|nr:NAD(P)-binding protein [Acidimicrobiaceae bacterium]
MSSGRVAGDQWPRRDFLRGGLGAAGIAAATPLLAACSGDGGDRGGDGQAADPQPADPPVATGERIVIVGAGAAALAAADELQIRGFHNVVLLEARDRVGGRIWTSSIGDGIPVELGATWMHGVRGNPISDIVESNRIATAETDYDNAVLYDHDGLPAESVDPALWGAYMALAYEMPEESLAGVFERFAATHGLSGDERRLWLHSLASMFSHEFGADISDLSIMSYDGPSTLRGGDVVFPGGYSQITDVLAAGRDIRLDHPVAGIDHSGPTAVVTTESGGAFEADRVVVTVPLGVLKADAISFSPALPPVMREAIAALDMGILNRTVLLFDEPFWDRDTEWIGYAGRQPGQWSETLNLYPYLGRPVLAMFNPGSFGAATEAYSDAELTSRAVEALRAMFEDVPDPVDAVSTRWGSDPWTRGSYSYLPVGVEFDTYRDMARPVGDRLFFAGEATHSRFPSTVHGALLSGRRAARQIAGLLR